MDNRRNFFIEFAAQKGFDPLVATNWDNVTYDEFFAKVIIDIYTEKRGTNSIRVVVVYCIMEP